MAQARSAAVLRSGRAPARQVSPKVLRGIPQIHALLELEPVRRAAAHYGRRLVTAVVRERLNALRRLVRSGALNGAGLEAEVAGIAAWVEGEAMARTSSTLRPVINATGVILHTNLGRAILPKAAVRRMMEVSSAYTTLEYDLERGSRGSRSSHLERLLSLLFPGKGFHIVNNNAAAVLLALNTLAEGKEVIVSRGELVEIGGSFRIPDVLRKSGAILREIGTTNKTRLSDYERALSPKTGLILKVHPSNYRIVGFTAQATLREITSLGRRRRIPVLFDQGSGCLIDLKPHGLRDEPSVHEALSEGADLVCFSGDKLLGGPQCGLVIGRPDLVRAMKENSLTRALRVDKITYGALEAVLLEYVRGTAETTLPVLRMVTMSAETTSGRARRLLESVAARAGDGLTLSMISGQSLSGGGSAPEEGLRTTLLAVTARGRSARSIENILRRHTTPVIARIEDGKVLLDLRTVLEEQEPALAEALVALAAAPR